MKNTLVYGPKHIVTALRILRKQPNEVRDIAHGAYHTYTENLIPTLFANEAKEDRFFAIGLIMKFRVGNELSSIEMRIHKTPELNFDASSPKNLIFWEKTQCYESIFIFISMR